jgi:hypothetical protein
MHEKAKEAVIDAIFADTEALLVTSNIRRKIDALIVAVRAESGLLWATYRPQHHDDCDQFRCLACGGFYSGAYPYLCRCVGLMARLRKPCSCGLSALLAQLETP